jgi:cysteine synthase A
MTPWIHDALRKIDADYQRSADTHLIPLTVPSIAPIQLYLKDESTHPTGSLKHRLARSLFLYGLCNGWIREGTTIVEASSGSTAVSEAYFARLLGLPFIAVMPATTSQKKIDQISFYGGQCHLITTRDIYAEAAQLAAARGGHYMDQFTYAERVTDWRGNNNIAESIFAQMAAEPDPIPRWIVVSAGTGGTSATIGRFLRYKRFHTELCVADPENSVFYDHFLDRSSSPTLDVGSRIEGIGRPRVEPSFNPSVVDLMIKVPDAASLATIHLLDTLLQRKAGGSTGTNLYAAFQLCARMKAKGETGSVVTMLCDAGERYLDTYYNPEWIARQGLDLAPYNARLEHFMATGELD